MPQGIMHNAPARLPSSCERQGQPFLKRMCYMAEWGKALRGIRTLLTACQMPQGIMRNAPARLPSSCERQEQPFLKRVCYMAEWENRRDIRTLLKIS